LIWLFPIAGLISLIWFLIRVLPKPSRATYPCQRVAAPLASGFVVWITGLIVSTLAYRKARRLAGYSRYVLAGIFVVLSVAVIWGAICITNDNLAEAASTGLFEQSDPPNTPMGVAKGIHPGRVAWIHQSAATSWDGSSNYWWSSQFNDQNLINIMLAKVVNSVAGGKTITESWDKLFRDLNKRKGKGDIGYNATEKIAIKLNLNSGGNSNRVDASPQMVYALLDELVNQAGVLQDNITLFDATRNNISAVSDYCRQAFPNVKYNHWNGWVENMIIFSSSEVSGSSVRRLPHAVVYADYFINMALLKRHCQFSSNWADSDGQTGVTLCGKNNFGTVGSPGSMHVSIRDWYRGMGQYNPIVDLIGSRYMGGNTVLYIVDGLYGGDIHNATPKRWHMAPFNNDWPSSVFASQDPIAIDSVCLDFLNTEWDLIANADNYLHEAALADNPPSGTVYQPDGVRLSSLGVHEHWNNPVDKQYSCNLGTGNGIELEVSSFATDDGPVENITNGKRYDYIQHAINEASSGDNILIGPGIYSENINLGGKNLTLRSSDPIDPAVVAATIISGGNRAVTFSGGEDTSCVLAGFTITGANTGIHCSDASPTINTCIVAQNGGAGIELHNGSNPTIINCCVAANAGAGIQMWARTGERTILYNYPAITNCTIAGNLQGGILGGIPTITNSIVWANSPEQIAEAGGIVSISYSDIQGGFEGEGNIDADPLFADPDNGDYHLKSQAGRWDPISERWVTDDVISSCIDAGDPNSDWSSETWPHGERVNMGAYGGTREASMSAEPQALSLPTIAYIYRSDEDTAESFQSFLLGYGCPTTLIGSDDAAVTPLDSYDLIIVANDTGYSSTWVDAQSIAPINSLGKPVLGLGEGGYDFFGQLELSIGWPNGHHGSRNNIYVIDPASPLYSSPYSLDVPEDRILQLYAETEHVGIYLLQLPEDVIGLGGESRHPTHYPLVLEQNRYLLWGFTESPLNMTEVGKTLFINIVIRTANRAWGS
jgi:parallel beta-helix repeat protein